MQTPTPNSEPKWAALIDDALYPMPRRKLTERDILDQCAAPPKTRLLRDRGTPDDGGFHSDELIDLGEGNVFRTTKEACARSDRDAKQHPAKLAYVCDDGWEVTLAEKQTGGSLKRLLGLDDSSEVFRDHEDPKDVPIADDEVIHFASGCVFRAQKRSGCHTEDPKSEEEIEVLVILENGQTKKLSFPGGMTLGEILAKLRAEYGVHLEAVLFEEDGDCEADPCEKLHVRGCRCLICHRCKKIEVSVLFNGQPARGTFSPGTTVKRLIEWAVKEFKLDKNVSWKLREDATDGAPLPEKRHIGTLVKAGECSLTLYLTPGTRIQG
jgi:hypothetical protein